MIIARTRKSPSKGALILAAIFLVAFLSRVIALWVTRPEFMGWFNHAPWYWVQTRGLMHSGELPFSDLPLLFYGYAAVAQGLEFFGLGREPAVVNASRFFMCLTPALIAWPCWSILQGINQEEPLRWPDWVLVTIAAFLPLTFVHMPELLQKNMLGLLLLAGLMHASYRALERPVWIAAALLWFTLIALTHLGTLAAACLWILALGIAVLTDRPGSRRALIALAVATAAGLIGWLVLKQFDPDALSRVSTFLSSSLQNSMLGALLGHSPFMGTAAGLTTIVVPLALAGLAIKSWLSARPALSRPDRNFWLANLLFSWLLVAPVTDLDILPRLVLFLPFPVLILLAFALRHGRRPRLSRLLVGLAGLGSAILVIGESQQLLRGHAYNTESHRELQQLHVRYQLGETDLVIAPYAVAPAMNWFLGTRAGLVTAINKQDFERFERVFVLNTGREQAPDWQGSVTVENAAARYRLMRQPVPLPENTRAKQGFEYFNFYRLESVPENWIFDETGRWSGVGG